MNTVQYTVKARSGAAVVIEVTYTSSAEAADVLDLAYDAAKRQITRGDQRRGGQQQGQQEDAWADAHPAC